LEVYTHLVEKENFCTEEIYGNKVETDNVRETWQYNSETRYREEYARIA
jgi:hypothetical protein